MQEYARVNLLLNTDGTPCVQFESSERFASMEPLEKVTMVNAALQICGMIIQALMADHPDEADAMAARLDAMSLYPGVSRPN